MIWKNLFLSAIVVGIISVGNVQANVPLITGVVSEVSLSADALIHLVATVTDLFGNIEYQLSTIS
jgi:hypothetical protein